MTRAFRQGECGRLHNPEFTMIEWYRVGDGMREGIELLDALCQNLLGRGPAESISYQEAFVRHVGLDPHRATAAELAAHAKALAIPFPESMEADDRDGWLDLLVTERVQPNLGTQRPAILFDYPASQAALARVRPDACPVAERFELYVAGIELANGYHELLDPAVLRSRNATNNAQRGRDGKTPLPEESRLLAAMDAGLPPATGVAMGLDRIAMLARRR